MKKDSKSTWQFINAVIGMGKMNIVILVLVQGILGISSVFYALFLRDIINGAVAGEAQRFYSAVVLFALLVCGQLALRAVLRYLEEHTRSALENRFKKRLFARLMQKDYAYVAAVHSGEWMNRLTSDTVVVANGLTDILPGLAGMVVKLLGAITMIVVLEPRFLYLLIPGGVLLIGFSYAFRKVMKRLHKEVQEQDGNLRMYMQESLASMTVVRSYGVEQEVVGAAAGKMSLHKEKRMKKNHFSNVCNIGFGVMMNGAYVLGAFFCGYGILKGTMSYGTFMAVLQLIGQIQAPFANISGFLPRYYSMIASCERLMEAEALRDRDCTEGKSLREVKEIYEKELESIGLSEVSFTYIAPVQEAEISDMPVVLSDFTIEIKKGEYVAFVGSSGCGKSTVLKILMGLYEPKCGERYLCRNGQRICLDGSYQKLFAYVPQGNHLMSGTIREIVAFAEKDAMEDEKRIADALRIACGEFVYELEQGIDTMLGERGHGLSEGQMQRIAIARAVFSEHPVLILDEATSALDEETEHRLLDNLRSMTNKTVLIVTHRPEVLKICDKVIRF